MSRSVQENIFGQKYILTKSVGPGGSCRSFEVSRPRSFLVESVLWIILAALFVLSVLSVAPNVSQFVCRLLWLALKKKACPSPTEIYLGSDYQWRAAIFKGMDHSYLRWVERKVLGYSVKEVYGGLVCSLPSFPPKFWGGVWCRKKKKTDSLRFCWASKKKTVFWWSSKAYQIFS